MATRLSEFAAAVHAELAANGISITQRDDVEALQQHDHARRIAWITPGGEVRPPLQTGGRMPSDGSAARARLCRTRYEDVEAHLFAESRELTEQLLDALIAAISNVGEVVEMVRYKWVTEEREHSGKTLRVRYCVLYLRLPLPVPDEIALLVTVTGQDHECSLEPPG